jgi:hypothetical protein
MRHLTTIIVLILWTLANCFGQTETNVVTVDHYKTKKFDVAIFPANYIDIIPGKRFTPTRQEVEKAEISLRENLKRLNHPLVNQTPNTIIHEKLDKYKRQYFGYVDDSGQKILLINCLWEHHQNQMSQGWLTERIYVLDGGSYYWQVKFNLDKNELFDLCINGHA